MNGGRLFLGVVIFIIGLLALAAGVIYMTTSAHALPSFMPGHLASPTATGHRTHRGFAGIAFGGLLLIISIAVMVSSRRHRYPY